MHLTQATAGNGIVTSKAYNPNTGRIDTIQVGPGIAVQNLSFTFNTLGNLTQLVEEWGQSASPCRDVPALPATRTSMAAIEGYLTEPAVSPFTI